jgi:hypothetical protein
MHRLLVMCLEKDPVKRLDSLRDVAPWRDDLDSDFLDRLFVPTGGA